MNADLRLSKASRWFIHLRDGKLSPRGLKALDRWLTVPQNAEVFAEMVRLWSEADQMPRLRSKSTSVPRVYAYLKPLASAATILLVIGAAATLVVNRWHSLSPSGHVGIFETSVAQHRDIVLDDGSRIQLGARTSVSTSISTQLRTVVLNSGEALFDVARDASRPFKVMAGGGTITAVGTAFNVKRRGDDHVVVTVTEGVVQVSPSMMRVEQGQEIVYDATGRIRQQTQVASAAVSPTWRTGELQYRSEPLRNVLPDINRYSKRQVVLGDRAAGELPFTGTVLERHVDEWIDRLGRIYPELEVTLTDSDNVLIRSR